MVEQLSGGWEGGITGGSVSCTTVYRWWEGGIIGDSNNGSKACLGWGTFVSTLL